MRFIIWLGILVVTAFITAWLFDNNHGHVTMYWNQYRVDLAMNLFLALSFLGFFLLFQFYKILSILIALPLKAKQYRLKQVEIKALNELKNSMEHLFAGRYAKSLKSAQLAISFKDTSQVSRMIAAQASHQLKQYSERDAYLEKIDRPDSLSTKYILKAQMLLDERKADEALSTLNQLQKSGARQFLVQALVMRAHQILQHWPQMLRLANSLMKRNYLPPALGRARVLEALTQWVNSGNVNPVELKKQWSEFGEDLYTDPSWVKLFAQGFLIAGDSSTAKSILDKLLDQAPEESLLEMYPKCTTHPLSVTPSVSLIQKLEVWIKKDPAHPSLHLALGEVCEHDQLWGKALYSFQQVLDSTRSSRKMLLSAHLGMMRIYEVLEDSERNAMHQKEALRIFSRLFNLN